MSNDIQQARVVVDGVTYRWRQGLADDRLTVWHGLDGGVLTVWMSTRAPLVSPRLLMRVIRQARETVWPSTALHAEMTLTEVAYDEGVRQSPRARRWPVLEEAFAVERQRLAIGDDQDMDSLQVLFVPGRVDSVAIHLSRTGRTVTVVSTNVRETVAIEPDVVEDLLVAAHAHPEGTAPESDVCSAELVARDRRGVWRFTGEVGAGEHRGRRVAHDVWRLAVESVSSAGARSALHRLQPSLRPRGIPFEVDEDLRQITVFGDHDASELAGRLRACTGPWVVVAENLGEVTGPARELQQINRRRQTEFVWLGSASLAFQIDASVRMARDRKQAWSMMEAGALEVLDAALLAFVRTDAIVEAGEAMTGADPERWFREGRVSTWLNNDWRPARTPPEGWWFTHRFEGWLPGSPEWGFVVRPGRAWVALGKDVVLEVDAGGLP